MKRFHFFLMALVSLASIVGCADSYEVAGVDGVLLIDGKPGDRVFVQFIPDIDAGTHGPVSEAETDLDGKFTLRISSVTDSQPGAVVGQHRITLSDMKLAESATGAGIPIRIPPDYSLPGTTPLVQTVHSGGQTVELVLAWQSPDGS
jgi:hypothetical protein